MDQQTIQKIFERFQENCPGPKTELEYTNPYTLLVAVVLSAQATDKGVNRATKNLFFKVSTPQHMLELGIESLKEFINPVGLYKTKAKNIIALSEVLIRDYQGQIPSSRESLEALPGVGRKTASVILNIAFNQETIAVDTHIFRVCNRTKIAVGKTPLAVELILEKNIPAIFRRHAHHWLILHGRYVCMARKPKCSQCIINDLCEYTRFT